MVPIKDAKDQNLWPAGEIREQCSFDSDGQKGRQKGRQTAGRSSPLSPFLSLICCGFGSGGMWRFRQEDVLETSGLHPGRCGRISVREAGVFAKVGGIFPQAAAVFCLTFWFVWQGDLSYDSALWTGNVWKMMFVDHSLYKKSRKPFSFIYLVASFLQLSWEKYENWLKKTTSPRPWQQTDEITHSNEEQTKFPINIKKSTVLFKADQAKRAYPDTPPQGSPRKALGTRCRFSLQSRDDRNSGHWSVGPITKKVMEFCYLSISSLLSHSLSLTLAKC